MSWVWVDGSVRSPFAAAEGASVSVDDIALLRGVGVFETFKVVSGVPFAMRRHLERLRDAARVAAIDVPWTDDELRSICAEVLEAVPPAADPDALLRLRITVTGGARRTGGGERTSGLVVGAEHGPPWPPEAVVVTDPHPVNERGPLVGAKVTSYLEQVVLLARAQERGADEAVRSNTVGTLCEGTASNLFVVVDGELCTPALSTGCLPGVTRALVMDLVTVHERDDLTVDDLRNAPEAFLTSSTRDVHPIRSVDGRGFDAVPGPLTAAAAKAFEALRARDLDP